jgi:hypothetical protein
MYGPLQTQEEHLWDIVIVEPSGSAMGSSLGVAPASVGIETPSYNVVLMKICILHQWRLRQYEIIRRTTRQCPPDMTTEVVREETSDYDWSWEQLPPIFPHPGDRTLLYTFGGSSPDPFEVARNKADEHARRHGLPRGEGPFQDYRG